MSRLLFILALGLTPFLTLSLNTSISFAFAADGDGEMLHKFFKGRRALDDGIDERVSPDKNQDIGQGAREVAQILESCDLTREKSGQVEDIFINGTNCQLNSAKSEHEEFTDQLYSILSTSHVAVTGDNILRLTGIVKSTVLEKQNAVLKPVGGDEYAIVSLAREAEYTLQTVSEGNARILERETFVIASGEYVLEFTLTMVEAAESSRGSKRSEFPGIASRTFSGSYRDVNGESLCAFNDQPVNCSVLAYMYGYEDGFPTP